jgi:hypothetical protein
VPTFREKREVNNVRFKSSCYEDLRPKNGWNFRYNCGQVGKRGLLSISRR